MDASDGSRCKHCKCRGSEVDAALATAFAEVFNRNGNRCALVYADTKSIYMRSSKSFMYRINAQLAVIRCPQWDPEA